MTNDRYLLKSSLNFIISLALFVPNLVLAKEGVKQDSVMVLESDEVYILNIRLDSSVLESKCPCSYPPKFKEKGRSVLYIKVKC